MMGAHANRIAGILPLLCSALAFAVVMANIITGVPPQPDENASAHIWQLLVMLQPPLILLFAVTADWRRWTPVGLIALQLFGIALACLPVWLAGY
jgi:hypothetical protein